MKKTINLRFDQLLIFILTLLFSCQQGYGKLTLPSLFCDNMVLQRDIKNPVWGWSEPLSEVEVQIAGQCKKAVADTDGKWMVKLDEINSSVAVVMRITDGVTSINLENVAIGEVWIASGQSNMQWSLGASGSSSHKGVFNQQIEVGGADYPDIRLFFVERQVSDKPKADCEGSWRICTPETVENFSAVGYFFAQRLHSTLKVPVGVVHTCWGGTQAESWIPRDVLESDPDFQPILERYDLNCRQYPQAKKKWEIEVKEWEKLSSRLKAEGKKVPAKPRAPEAWSFTHYRSPYKLYNSMISPLIPYGIRGVIWYQGESNAWRGFQYRKLFASLIKSWRQGWGQGDFPFYYVQLPPYKYSSSPVAPELREAQLMTLSLPNTGMVVTTDIGDPTNIHPRNKRPVGDRLALWAFAKVYGFEDIVYSGPIYKSMSIENDKIRLFFDHVGSGLIARGDELRHFEIAGANKEFVSAVAVIEGDSVVVSSEKVEKPLAVRFGWSNTAEPNFFNKEGLPASPFRTDDWPGVTFKER
jgi:sialate O-acetylesterase